MFKAARGCEGRDEVREGPGKGHTMTQFAYNGIESWLSAAKHCKNPSLEAPCAASALKMSFRVQ